MEDSSSNQQQGSAVPVISDDTIDTVLINSSTTQPSDVVLSSGVSSTSNGESLQELQAEYERMKAELEEQKKSFFRGEMARMKEQQQHWATLRSQSSRGGAARSMASFQTPGPLGMPSSSLDMFQGPSPVTRHDMFEVVGRSHNWVQVNKASVQGACKPLSSSESINIGDFNHVNAIYTTINSIVRGHVDKGCWAEPIPSDCFIIHNVAMASHASERRAIQEWREAIFDEHQRQPNFDELLVFLREQANGRKSNATEILMMVYKLPFTKPATGMEASAVVHSFLSQAEALGLQSSEHSHMLIGLILYKLEDVITPEGLQKITITVANFHSKVESEQRSAAAVVASSGIFVWLSREIARFFNSKYVPTFMAQVPETAVSSTVQKQAAKSAVSSTVQKQAAKSGAAKKPKESNSDPSIPPSDSSISEKIPVCHGQVFNGSCKYGSECRYSHDEKRIAAKRKEMSSRQ
jgi:hypothetical protein